MPEKGFAGAPFGFQSSRFGTNGVHPKNLLPGTFITQGNSTSATSADIGPGAYDPDYGGFSSSAVAKRAAGPGWQREYEVAHMMALPYLLHKDEWEQRKQLVQKLGPGTYDPQDITTKKDVSKRGLLDLKESRFRGTIHSDVPGPGTYGIPHAPLEAKRRQRFGTKGMLESGGDGLRSLPMVGSHLGPGTYHFPDSIDQMLQKHTSNRGPYDLFTPERSQQIMTGHYATLVSNNLGPGQYPFKSGVEDMNSSHKKRHGQFLREVQYPRKPHDRIVACTLSLCPRNPSEPGPGHYDPINPKERPMMQGKNLPPFSSSSQRYDRMATKFFTGNFNSVGAGRYDVQKFDNTRNVDGHRSVFVSKTNRPEGDELKMLEHRIKTKNIRRNVDQKPLICTESGSKIAVTQHSNLKSDAARWDRPVTVS